MMHTYQTNKPQVLIKIEQFICYVGCQYNHPVLLLWI